MLDGAARVEKLAAVGEAVWRDVENAHDQRAFAEHEFARWQAQCELRAANHGTD